MTTQRTAPIYDIPDDPSYYLKNYKYDSNTANTEYKHAFNFFKIITPAKVDPQQEFPKYVNIICTRTYTRKLKNNNTIDESCWGHYVYVPINKCPEFMMWYLCKYKPSEAEDYEWIHPVNMNDSVLDSSQKILKQETYNDVINVVSGDFDRPIIEDFIFPTGGDIINYPSKHLAEDYTEEEYINNIANDRIYSFISIHGLIIHLKFDSSRYPIGVYTPFIKYTKEQNSVIRYNSKYEYML